jgi:FlaA1/EpsC-like NDP-sugar epimerase
MNGGRVLALDGVAPAGRALTRVALVGTAATIRQLTGAIGGSPGVVANAAIVIGDKAESGQSLDGFSSLCGMADIPLLAARFGIKIALVCIPVAMKAERERVSAALRQAGIAECGLAAVEDVLNGVGEVGAEEGIEASRHQGIKAEHRFQGAAPSINLAELIGRKPYEMDREAISGILGGRCVLITGAGGSIGSELAKVAAAFEPSLLVLMERAENALFEIDRQIARHFPGVPRKAVLHDVVDAEATLRLCEKLRPQVLFHAAAHKHVPLMEDHPAHAVTNNLFGTKSIVDAAVAVGAERFVMISSDKAVNPTSVMGATKRLAEMYVRGVGQSAKCKVQSANQNQPTRLSMVRFGNVLGSAASVLTIWAQQIAEGGPITITDPRMTRYFMTIPEAATLVVQSAALEPEGSEGSRDRGIEGARPVGVFVLDMGEPVKIVDLASRFVMAHGMMPRIVGDRGSRGDGQTIDLVFTGIRPGEKLHEELAYAAEQLLPTAHPGVRAWAGPGFGAEVAASMSQMVNELQAARFSTDPARVVEAIRRHVPEMRGAQISPEPAAAVHAG